MNIVVEKGVPQPTSRGFQGVSAVLRSMEVGESFLFPKAKRTTAASLFGRFSPRKFITRSVSDEQIRVWRIE